MTRVFDPENMLKLFTGKFTPEDDIRIAKNCLARLRPGKIGNEKVRGKTVEQISSLFGLRKQNLIAALEVLGAGNEVMHRKDKGKLRLALTDDIPEAQRSEWIPGSGIGRPKLVYSRE